MLSFILNQSWIFKSINAVTANAIADATATADTNNTDDADANATANVTTTDYVDANASSANKTWIFKRKMAIVSWKH